MTQVSAAPYEQRHARKLPPVRHRPGMMALESAAAGLLSLVPLPAPLRAVLLAVFILTGPGLAVVIWLRLPTPTMVGAIPVLGLSVMTGFTVALTWMNVWIPTGLLLILIGAVVVSAVVHLSRARGLAPVVPMWRRGAKLFDNGPLVLILASLGVWTVLLPGMVDVPYSQFGLLPVGSGPGLIVIVVLIVLAFVWALRTNRVATAGLAIAATIVVQRVTATLITEVPIYTWTYKHLGVVDFIQQHQTLPPPDVYSEWPAFFTAFAWFGDITSVDMSLVAHWFAPVIHALLALLIGTLAMVVGLEFRHAVTAAMIAELANWVGQDYFAPQALATVMGVGFLGLLVASRVSTSAGYLALLVFAAIIPTHQLTPFWLLAVVVLLAVARIIHPWWLPIPYAVMLFGYLISRMYVVAGYGLFSGFDPISNGSTDFAGSLGKLVTSSACRGLSAAVVLTAFVAVFVWWRRGWRFGIPTIIAFTPFVILFVQSYGGEAIFRVYLYALPGCAILISPLLLAAITRDGRHGTNHRSQASVAAFALAVAGVASLQSYYGIWTPNVQTRSQLSLFENLLGQIHGPATIWSLDSTGVLARATADYVTLAQHDKDFDASIAIRWPDFVLGFPDAHQFDGLTEDAESRSGETYFVFTQQASDHIEYVRSFTPTAVAEFENQIHQSPFWSVRLQDDRTTVYQFHATDHQTGSPGGK